MHIYLLSFTLSTISESQITPIKIGGKTVSARYSGRGMYDVRFEDANEEIRNRIASHELVAE
jgi:hypothetical protein